MNVRSFFNNLRSQFFPKRTATLTPTAPVQRPHSGLVQTVISRSDTQTGVKTPISRTPVTAARSAAPSMSVQPVNSRMSEK